MAAELRWILLVLSMVLLGGICWWGARRSRQAAGNAQLRESPFEPHGADPRAAQPANAAPAAEVPVLEEAIDDLPTDPKRGGWGVPPLEPLSIRTGGFDEVPVLDYPMMATQPMMAVPPAAPAAAPAPQAPNDSKQQMIVTVRVCATGETRWPGAALMSALEENGLAFGRYQVYHRRHADGRSLFCAASLVEPGTFDLAGMADDEFRGVSLFAVLPGPIDALQTVEELLTAARGLAEKLSGMVQDAKGMPMSPQRSAALRAEVARFQASLS